MKYHILLFLSSLISLHESLGMENHPTNLISARMRWLGHEHAFHQFKVAATNYSNNFPARPLFQFLVTPPIQYPIKIYAYEQAVETFIEGGEKIILTYDDFPAFLDDPALKQAAINYRTAVEK
jgi:hypothetical protein